MGTDRPDDRVPPHDPAVPEPPEVPAFEWVFGSNTVLGGVAPGHRDLRHNGNLNQYAPWGELGGGAGFNLPGPVARRATLLPWHGRSRNASFGTTADRSCAGSTAASPSS